MKQLILIKQCQSSMQLAHLYEHIFYDHITDLFYTNGLFQYIDYSLKGATYRSGIIQISLELYNSHAVTVARQIKSIEIQFTQAMISTSASQLIAEEEEPFTATSYEKVRKALFDLQAQSWQNIDELNDISAKKTRRTPYPFCVCEGGPLPARKLTSSVMIDPNFAHLHPYLLPLFRQIALTVLFTTEDTLTSSCGYYGDDTFMTNNKQKVCMSNTFKVAHRNDIYVDIQNNLQAYLKNLNHMKQSRAFERLIADLKSISYTDRPLVAPNLAKNYEDTLIFIGAKGWHEIATIENIELLLKYMSIEVKFGRKKVSTPLVGN